MTPWLASRSRDRRRQVEQLPALLHALSRSLRSGATLFAALQDVAADPSIAGDEFRRAAARVGSGSAIEAELDQWAAALDNRDANLVRAVVNTGAATGSALAASFDRAASSLQERADLQREIDALTAQARASALLLTLAPVLFLGLMASIDPSVLATATATGGGRVALTLGVFLDLAGWAWMRRLTAAVDP